MQGLQPSDVHQVGQQSWQSDQDKNDRDTIRNEIFKLFPPWESPPHLNTKLPAFLKLVEEKLYRSAQTKAEYQDVSTLPSRFREARMQIMKNPPDPGLQPSYGQQAGQQPSQGLIWQDQDQDSNDRKAVLDELFKLSAPDLSQTQITREQRYTKQLQFTTRIEEELYRSAQTKDEYRDLSTLRERLQGVLLKFEGNPQDSGLQGGEVEALLGVLASLSLA